MHSKGLHYIDFSWILLQQMMFTELVTKSIMEENGWHPTEVSFFSHNLSSKVALYMLYQVDLYAYFWLNACMSI